ncbi:hypothetical protein SHIRM173S_05140 [Streptomyces hirsutus]
MRSSPHARNVGTARRLGLALAAVLPLAVVPHGTAAAGNAGSHGGAGRAGSRPSNPGSRTSSPGAATGSGTSTTTAAWTRTRTGACPRSCAPTISSGG